MNNISEDIVTNPKTLVIILSETRAHELTFDNFKKNVIDELNADLCLCIGTKSDYNYDNPYYKLAKYHFLYNEENDKNFSESVEYSYNHINTSDKYERLDNINCIHSKINDPYHCDNNIKYLGEFNDENEIDLNSYPENDIFVYHKKEVYNEFMKKLYSIKNNDDKTYVMQNNMVSFLKKKHYTEFLKIKDRIFSENLDPTHFSDFLISTYIHIFFLWFLHINIREHNLIDKYDRFVIARSDYIYQLPFPKMNILSDTNIWIPDDEDHGGLCDRTVVLSKHNLENCINILESFYRKSNKYYLNINNDREWNMEKIYKMHLEENNLYHTVKRFPYIMYAVRPVNGSTRWSKGIYSKELGYFIKYPNEYNKSTKYKNEFFNSGLNIDDFYKKKINNNVICTLRKMQTTFKNIDNLIVQASVKDDSDSMQPFTIGMHYTYFFSFNKGRRIQIGDHENTVLCCVNTITDSRRRPNGKNRNFIIRTLSLNNINNIFVDPNKYYEELPKYKFVISPEGNGIDCHRHYEALIAGCIPIIEYNHEIAEKYKGCPILFTDDYSEITEEYLLKKYDEMIDQTYDFSKLFLSYFNEPTKLDIKSCGNYWMQRHLRVKWYK